MSFFKGLHIFVCVCCIAFVRGEEMCDQQYKSASVIEGCFNRNGTSSLFAMESYSYNFKVNPETSYLTYTILSLPNWEPHWKKFPPPANVSLGAPPECRGGLEARIHDQRENFNLTLLAHPFIKDGNCPTAESNYLNLRKFHRTSFVDKDNKTSQSVFFGKIFTGCYYIEMSNAEGKKWLWGGLFQTRKYHYHDTILKCNSFHTKPEERDAPTELRYNIEIPMTCFQLSCLLYEQQTDHTKDVLNSGKIPAVQNCSITYNGTGKMPLVECKWNSTHPQLLVGPAIDKGKGWRIKIRWSNLRRSVDFYSTKWEQPIHNCHPTNSVDHICDDVEQINDYPISHSDLFTWESVIKFGAFVHVLKNVSNNPPPEMVPREFLRTTTFMTILYILLSVAVTVILVYWMSKYAKVLLGRERAAHNLLAIPSEIVHDQEESNHILLIYAYDLPLVMGAMEALKSRLQQISRFRVHALYSNDDMNIIMRLGATGWVESLLRDGSKVVWVDTPQFRSILKGNQLNKGQQKQCKQGDFRDQAIPYAVALAKDLYQNATTQYRYHFVVRIEGLEVEDGNDDPLQVVSPLTRYYIPEHLDLLCDHLA